MKGFDQTMRRVLLGGCALAAMAMAMGTAAAAQTAPAASQDDAADVEDIVVTAQRRSERLIDVPMSVVAVTPETIEKSGAVNIHDISSIVPGVQVNFGGGFTQPAVRGISTLTTGVGFENNVATYVDGFYTPDNVTINSDLANVAGIEVLKGPQGTLWGRNATGGAILIATKAPSEVLTGDFSVSYGTFNDRSLTAYVSGPLTDQIRYSIAAHKRESDSYNDLIGPTGAVIGHASPLEQASVRAKLEMDLSEKLKATVGYNYGVADDPRGQLFTVFRYASPALPTPPGRADQPYTYSSNRQVQDRGETNEGTLKLVYQLENGTITSYSGYAVRDTVIAFDFDGSYADLTYSLQNWRQKTFQQGLDYNVTLFDKLDLVVGASYYKDRLNNLLQESYAANALVSNLTGHLGAEAYAAYVDGTYKLTDVLTLNVGARYTRETKEAAYRQVRPDGSNLVQPGFGEKTFSAFTPRASLRYELGSRTNVYASYAQGFRTGGFPPNSASSPELFIPFEPERITAYEVGYKTANRLFQFSTAAFYYDYTDLQVGVTIPNPVCSTCNVIQLVSNAPKAEVYGVDGQIDFEPIERLQIRLGGAYLHGRYRDFTNATGNGFNSTTQRNVTGQIQDWSDQQMARSPTFTANLGIDYTFVGVFGGELRVGTNVNYSDSYVLSNPSLFGPLAAPELQKKQRYRQPAFTTANAQATWTDASQSYKVTVYVKNLADERHRLTLNGGAFGDYSSWASPRTYGVRLGYAF